jgi:hypothetical protein|tara:strand:+ start:716 stop:871 length:156 start_codon:yes stop_codon:yes gene_type:complete
MANIYKDSLWGYSSSTGFGNIYYNYSLVGSFNLRVLADGGIVESLECITIN